MIEKKKKKNQGGHGRRNYKTGPMGGSFGVDYWYMMYLSFVVS